MLKKKAGQDSWLTFKSWPRMLTQKGIKIATPLKAGLGLPDPTKAGLDF
jgi:hypothetical protein